jgi:hypothetical protein
MIYAIDIAGKLAVSLPFEALRYRGAMSSRRRESANNIPSVPGKYLSADLDSIVP